MKISLPVLMLGMFSLYSLQAQAEKSCEQLQKELEDNKHNILKKLKIKKQLKHCQPAATQATQGAGAQLPSAQNAFAPDAPQVQNVPEQRTPIRAAQSILSPTTLQLPVTQACGAEIDKVITADMAAAEIISPRRGAVAVINQRRGAKESRAQLEKVVQSLYSTVCIDTYARINAHPGTPSYDYTVQRLSQTVPNKNDFFTLDAKYRVARHELDLCALNARKAQCQSQELATNPRACDQEFQKVLNASARMPAAPGFKTETLYDKTFLSLRERDSDDPCRNWYDKSRAMDRLSRNVTHAVPSWMTPDVPYWQRNNYATQLHQFTLCALRQYCANGGGVKDVSAITWWSGRPAPPPPQEYVRPPGHIPMGKQPNMVPNAGAWDYANARNESANERRKRERDHQKSVKQWEEDVRRNQAEQRARQQRQADEAARQRQGGGNATPRPVARPDLYGALAIDYAQGRAYGWALNARSQAEANQYALSHCNGSTSGQCQVVMQFRNTCASYAIDSARGSTVYGWAWGAVQSNVNSNALTACQNRGGPGSQCMLRVWGCTAH